MVEYQYRTFWPRFCAGMLDGLFFVLPVYALIYATGWHLTDSAEISIKTGIFTTLFYLSFPAYSILMHGKFGATIGKMVFKIRVLDVSENRVPGCYQAFLRDSFYILTAVIILIVYWYYIFTSDLDVEQKVLSSEKVLNSVGNIWFFVEVITMLMNQKRRALHDLIAGTVVVRN